MAELEKGVTLQKLATSETDAKQATAKEVADYLSQIKSRAYDKVPENFVGKSTKGYILYDMVWHKRKGAAKTNK